MRPGGCGLSIIKYRPAARRTACVSGFAGAWLPLNRCIRDYSGASRATKVMLALSSFEIGHETFAFSAAA